MDAEIERRAKVALRADELLEVGTLAMLAAITDYSLSQEAEKLLDFDYKDPEIDGLLKQMELPPGEEREASFKRGHSPESVASGGTVTLPRYALLPTLTSQE